MTLDFSHLIGIMVLKSLCVRTNVSRTMSKSEDGAATSPYYTYFRYFVVAGAPFHSIMGYKKRTKQRKPWIKRKTEKQNGEKKKKIGMRRKEIMNAEYILSKMMR